MTANPSAATLGIVLSTVPLLVVFRSGDPAAKSFVSQRLPGNRSAIAELAKRKVPATIVRTSLFILTSPAHGTRQFIYHNTMAQCYESDIWSEVRFDGRLASEFLGKAEYIF